MEILAIGTILAYMLSTVSYLRIPFSAEKEF